MLERYTSLAWLISLWRPIRGNFQPFFRDSGEPVLEPKDWLVALLLAVWTCTMRCDAMRTIHGYCDDSARAFFIAQRVHKEDQAETEILLGASSSISPNHHMGILCWLNILVLHLFDLQLTGIYLLNKRVLANEKKYREAHRQDGEKIVRDESIMAICISDIYLYTISFNSPGYHFHLSVLIKPTHIIFIHWLWMMQRYSKKR